jgi:agarase
LRLIGSWRFALALTVAVPGAPAQESRAKRATGFFHAEKREGRWWLIDPAGKPFISKGVASVQIGPDQVRDNERSSYHEAALQKYGTVERWREAAAERLLGLGFNTLGAWSDPELAKFEFGGRQLAFTPVVDFVGRYVLEKTGARAWQKGIFPDVFDPAFEAFVRKYAMELCAKLKDNPALLGWFTDNELRWGADWRGKDELLPLFLGLPVTAPGRQVALQVLRERHSDVLRFDDVWQKSYLSWDAVEAAGPIPAPRFTRRVSRRGEDDSEPLTSSIDPKREAYVADCEAFVEKVAERYFQLTSDAIREADPNHMVLGCRFAYVPAAPVIAAAARHVSVISFNCYAKDPRWAIGKYAASGKPLLIGEFCFRGRDSGLPNTKGSGPLVPNQVDRASGFSQYVRLAVDDPNVVGYHWFAHADEPAEGRGDGENSNVGLVDIRDRLYEVLARRMARVNGEADADHAR